MSQRSKRPQSDRIFRSVPPYLILVAALALACGSAEAASCPAFPAPVVKFTPMPSDVERDTSKTAKELGNAAKPMPVGYEHALSGSTARSVTMQKLPDGTICAALAEVDFKLGVKRKIYVAQEFAGDGCVADTMAALEMPMAESDDAVLAQFGASIAQRFAADFKAIGTASGQSQDEAQKPLLEKISSLWQDRIMPAFAQQADAAAAKVDAGHWQKASCNGATDKAFAVITGKTGEAVLAGLQAPMQMPAQPKTAMTSGMGMGMGMMNIGMGMGR